MKLRWIRIRERRELTWPARGAVLLLALALVRLSAPGMYLWLACGERLPVNPPRDVVIEGWLNDAALDHILPWLREHGESLVFCTGGPVETGSILVPYHSYAEVTRQRLVQAGIPDERVRSVPAPYAARDRTLASALALRAHLEESSMPAGGRLLLISEGAHTRRSRLLFERALRGIAKVEAWGIPPSRYGRNDWWTLSAGFKTVTGEMIALPYTWLQRSDTGIPDAAPEHHPPQVIPPPPDAPAVPV
ncbi:MAG: YdcF family protein [Kiritimatiellae bacterium]|nr:YdcF family protein [Kiritimatiellia bacterium]